MVMTYFVFDGRQFRRRFLFCFDKSVFGLLQLSLSLVQAILILRHRRFVFTANQHGADKH